MDLTADVWPWIEALLATSAAAQSVNPTGGRERHDSSDTVKTNRTDAAAVFTFRTANARASALICRMYYVVMMPTMLLEIFEDPRTGDRYPQKVVD